ncbi:MAG: LysR family transcriptional regulator substrate-binding protein, partial [Solobacterium sp.]|nr:LysR family transcriptional regulator substrate-binding protein [Solobacterium sp.]
AVELGFVSAEQAEGIRKEVLRTVRMKAVLPPDHPLADREIVPLTELKKDPFILVELGRYSEPLQAFASLHIKPKVRYTIADDYTIMSMVEAGMGVSILSEMVLQRANYNIAIRDTDPPVLRPICIGWREPEMLPVAARRMMDFIRTRLDQLP